MEAVLTDIMVFLFESILGFLLFTFFVWASIKFVIQIYKDFHNLRMLINGLKVAKKMRKGIKEE